MVYCNEGDIHIEGDGMTVIAEIMTLVGSLAKSLNMKKEEILIHMIGINGIAESEEECTDKTS